jgi:hypothetical protein
VGHAALAREAQEEPLVLQALLVQQKQQHRGCWRAQVCTGLWQHALGHGLQRP